MLWTILLLLNGLLIIVFLFSTRTRGKHEPPLDKGWVPWLGHALEFGKDAAKFLARMKEKHGDIFTVCVAGHYVNVLLDANSFDSVLNDTVFLDFTPKRNQLLKRIFSLQLPSINPTAARKWMEQHFEGPCLAKLSSSMNTHLKDMLLSDQQGCSPSEWKQERLFSLCYSLLFRAGYLTMFEKGNNATAVYKEFRKFDNLVTKLARPSLKPGVKKTAILSREQLWELLSSNRMSRATESNSLQQSYSHFLQEEGVDAEMQKRATLLMLWTTQCNVGPAAFWFLGFLLTNQEAIEALKSEIRGFSLQDTALQHPPINFLEACRTPVFDSILSETLRLTSAVMISREVIKDKVLRMADGQEYHLRRGDTVCLVPFLSPQMDPEIYQEPEIFKYDRFLNSDMTVKDKFYKNGKRMKYHTMPWGAGINCCSGKEFAVRAIKQHSSEAHERQVGLVASKFEEKGWQLDRMEVQNERFVFLVLTHLNLELCDPEAKLPPVISSRYGFGMLQPDGDLQVRYRLKTHPDI